jgi:transcriptional regulator with XRE-family HTH domain
MKRSQDTFVFTHEFGVRLRELRLKAGLTQLELARAMGRAGKNAGNLVSRLERGDERYPSFGLVADFLRGCRAGFRDIVGILDLYTELPTTQQQTFGKALAKVTASVPEKWRPQVTKYDLRIEIPKSASKSAPEQPKPGLMKRLERARKMAAAARRRYLYGQFLSQAVNETGLRPVTSVRVPLVNHGLEWFRILYETRKAKPGAREKLLAESEAKFEHDSRFPLDAIRKLEDGVRRHFGEMEMKGELEWLPSLSLEEYEASLLKPTRKRSLKQEQLDQFRHEFEQYDAARKAAVEQVWKEVQPVLDKAGVPEGPRAVYRGVITACCVAATSFEPGSLGEKKQLDERLLDPNSTRRGLDAALAQNLAAIALARFRELAESFPPDPRPKR